MFFSVLFLLSNHIGIDPSFFLVLETMFFYLLTIPIAINTCIIICDLHKQIFKKYHSVHRLYLVCFTVDLSSEFHPKSFEYKAMIHDICPVMRFALFKTPAFYVLLVGSPNCSVKLSALKAVF